MLNSRLSSISFSGLKLQSKANGINNLRCATGLTAESVPYSNKESLEAAKPYEELPSMRMLPLVGSGWVYFPIIGRYSIDQFTASMEDKRKLFGNIFRDKLGPMNFVVSFNADDVKTMYENEGPYPLRAELESVKAYRESRKQWYTTLGISLLNGKEWLDLRQMTQKHLMKPKAIQAFLNPMQDVARDVVEKILQERNANEEMPDFLEVLSKWSLESVSLVCLDARLGCLEANLPQDSDGLKMINSVRTGFETLLHLETFFGNIPFWKYFPTPTWKKFSTAMDTFTEVAYKCINRSLEKLQSTSSEDRELTLLQSILLTKGMDVSTAMVTMNDMMLAGIDTTSNTVGFFLYHIAKNPDKQELLYQYIKKALPHKEDRITPTIFNELRYLKACLKESQRLNPIVGGHVRISDHDVIFSGYRIPAGTALLVVVQGIFKDERYFSSPNEFLPERWLSKDEKFQPFAFLPFGFGTRSCIGRRLAELEMICLTAELIRNFKIEYNYEDIGVQTRIITVPDRPLTFKFTQR